MYRIKRQPLPDYLPCEIVEHKLPDSELILPNILHYEIIGKNSPNGVAHEIIEFIAKLYAIESRAVKDGLKHQQLKAKRQLKATPILNTIKG